VDVIRNTVKERLARGEVVVGHFLNFCDASVAEVMSRYATDWLLIDAEHAPVDLATIENHIRAMATSGLTPLVRVASNDPATIKRVLDRGAMGVLVPLVSSEDEARAAVAAAKYPPDGIRGVAGTRASGFGADLGAYFDAWNREVLVACQIETLQGIRHANAIAATPGVDVIFVGPNDLSAALQVFRQFDSPAYRAALDVVLSAAERNGKAAGIMTTSAEEALAAAAHGFRFIAAGTDARLLAGAASTMYATIQAGLARKSHPR
jgi:2-keto-3-deoxy-L-rhamnonate aldolase RhmA